MSLEEYFCGYCGGKIENCDHVVSIEKDERTGEEKLKCWNCHIKELNEAEKKLVELGICPQCGERLYSE